MAVTAYNTDLVIIYKVLDKTTADGLDTELENHLEVAYGNLNLMLRPYESAIPVVDADKVTDLQYIEATLAAGYFIERSREPATDETDHVSAERKEAMDLFQKYLEAWHTKTEGVQDTPVIHFRSTRKM